MISTTDSSGWRHLLAQPLATRLGPAPQALIAHVAAVGRVTGRNRDAVACDACPAIRDEISRAIAGLPQSVQSLLTPKILGVYFGRFLGSSAISDIVIASDGTILGTAIVLDLDVLEPLRANSWASWKENTPFKEDGPNRVAVRIETAENDTRQNALQYLLLHEFGHAVCVGEQFVPAWWAPATGFRSTEEYAFLQISWQIAMSGDIIALLRDEFPLRKSLCFYADRPLANARIDDACEALEATRFVTLYAATSVYEDFAESFAGYVHTVLLEKPFYLGVERHGALQCRAAPYWDSPRAVRKRRLLEALCGTVETSGHSAALEKPPVVSGGSIR